MIFGDPAEPHHHEALTITGRTEQAVAAVLCRDAQVSEADAATTARVVSAVTFLAMAASVNVAASVDEIPARHPGADRSPADTLTSTPPPGHAARN